MLFGAGQFVLKKAMLKTPGHSSKFSLFNTVAIFDTGWAFEYQPGYEENIRAFKQE